MQYGEGNAPFVLPPLTKVFVLDLNTIKAIEVSNCNS